jgi:hypothetical protein
MNKKVQSHHLPNLYIDLEASLEASLKAFGGETNAKGLKLRQDRAAAMLLLTMMQNNQCPKLGESLRDLGTARVILDVLPREVYHYNKNTAGNNLESLKTLDDSRERYRKSLGYEKEKLSKYEDVVQTTTDDEELIEKGRQALNTLMPPLVMPDDSNIGLSLETMKSTADLLQQQLDCAIENFNYREKRRLERTSSLNDMVGSLLKTVGKHKEEIDQLHAKSDPNCTTAQSKFIDVFLLIIINFLI